MKSKCTQKKSWLAGWLVLTGLSLQNPSAYALKSAKVVAVNCAKGESVSKALEEKGEELVVEIEGMCQEDVFIRRDNVTLRGIDPNNDGIQAVGVDDPRGAAVFVRDARHIHLENLKLTGGAASGLRVSTSRREIHVTNCRMEGNGRSGAVIIDSAVIFQSSFVGGPDATAGAGFPAGIVAGEAAIASINDTTVTCGIGCIALLTDQASLASVASSNLSSGPGGIAVNAFGSSRVTIRDSQISVSPQEETTLGLGFGFALFADGQGDLRVIRSSFEGAIFATEDSLVSLFGSTQSSNPHPGGNTIELDSTLRVRPGGPNGSALKGVTRLHTFSNAVFTSGDPARPVTLEDLACEDPSAEALCQGPSVTFATSSCGLCPPPAP